MDERLREKLLEMRANDARERERLAATGELFDGYHPLMERVHLENAAELERLIDKHGWLGKSLVGADGADAAWLVAQHAISLPAFSRRCLRLIERAVAEAEAEPRHLAYLEDRINFFEGKPQRYGTQSDWNETGAMEVWTLADAARVNEFRRAAGLPPLNDLIWESEETRENQPKDFQARKKEFEAWARKVGWRKTI